MALRYSANLSMLYTDVPFLDRFARAAQAGFKAVEYLFPYDFGLQEIRLRLQDLGLEQVLFNLHAGDTAAGNWGSLSDPYRRDYFRWSFTAALESAALLDCKRLNCMFGQRVAGIELSAQFDCAVENLSWAAPIADNAGVKLLIEPLNSTDFPNYALRETESAVTLINNVNRANVELQYDVYHARMTDEDLIDTIWRRFPLLGHIQVADVPGRHQPGTGGINFKAVFDALEELNYSGYIGLEYKPAGDTDASLAWLPREARACVF